MQFGNKLLSLQIVFFCVTKALRKADGGGVRVQPARHPDTRAEWGQHRGGDASITRLPTLQQMRCSPFLDGDESGWSLGRAEASRGSLVSEAKSQDPSFLYWGIEKEQIFAQAPDGCPGSVPDGHAFTLKMRMCRTRPAEC